MAKTRRMINETIYNQDDFLDMPASARDLYTYLNINADDEGFVGNAKSVMRTIGARDDDLRLLITKRYVLTFETGRGVVVIKHWLIHNTIRQDRIIQTTYRKEKEELTLNEYGAYTEKNKGFLKEKDFVIIEEKEVSDNSPLNLINLSYTNDTNSINYLLIIKEIIDYLNNKLGTRYTYKNSNYNSKIKARIDEGATVEDFKKVIDVKYKEWFGTDMAKFLNPDTLFRVSNFEKYVNQEIASKEKSFEEKTVDKWGDLLKNERER